MSNIFERLNNLNPRPQRAIATVVSVANGMTTVQHADGSYQAVIGDSVASGKVYIVDGAVQAAAADLDYAEIEV